MTGVRAKAHLLSFLLLPLFGVTEVSAQRPPGQPGAPAPFHGQLDLAGQRTYAGEWHPGGEPGEILWRPDFLAEPVPFAAADAVGILLQESGGAFPTAAASVLLQEDLGSLSADPVSLDEHSLVVESPLFSGRLAIPREWVRRIEWRETAPGYLGPGLPSEWQAGAHGRSVDDWSSDANGLATDVVGAELWKDLGLAAPSRIEISLATTGSSSGFRLVLGAPGHPSLYSDGLFIETWGNRLVAYRELEETLEIASLGSIEDKVDLVVEWDPKRRVARVVIGGSPLAEVRLGERTSTGLAIRNLGGRLAVRALEVTRTSGLDGLDIGATGELAGGEVASFEVGFLHRTEGGEIPLSEVAGITFPPRIAVGAPLVAPAGEVAGLPVRLIFRDRSVLAATYIRHREDGLAVALAGLGTELVVPLDELRGVEFRGNAPARPLLAPHRLTIGSKTRIGTCAGWDPGRRGLLWRPDGSRRAAPLAEAFEGSVLLAQESEYFVGRTAAPHDLHLADGDRVAVRIISVDEAGLLVASPFGGEHRIPASELCAIELDARGLSRVLPESKPEETQERRRVQRQAMMGWHAGDGAPLRDRDVIDEERRGRALSLPRQGASRPPTHLLIGRNGDLLRGRLVSIGPGEVRFDVHLEEIRIPIEDVVGVVRLDPPPEGAPEPGAIEGSGIALREDAGAPATTWVQLVLGERMRLNARLEAWDEGKIVAETRWLGRIEIPVAEVERVAIGDALRSRLDPRFEGWVLEVLPDPTPPPEPAATPPAGG